METENSNAANKFPNPVRITYRDINFNMQAAEAANHINMWHKFILYNVEKTDKTLVLDTLIEACLPIHLIPVMYTMEGEKKASFLTFCRSNTVQKLVNQKLQLKLRTGKVINFDIVLSFLNFKDMQLNVQKIITNAIRLRVIKEPLNRKSLNLENFTNDRLMGSVYCPIHIPLVLDQVLRFSKPVLTPNSVRDNKLTLSSLILKNNNMEVLQFNEKLSNFHFSKLDVRDNKLTDLSLLRPFTELKITELLLDGNPLCGNYNDPKEYVCAVKSYFPHLKILDGQDVRQNKKIMPKFNNHFILDKSKVDLVKQFLEHFFTCYDQDDRIVLNGLYDAGALFSMTIGRITLESHKQILKSFANNRNLLKFVDYAKCTEFLLNGPERIIATLKREPATLHKLKYLDIDVLYSTNNCIAVAVQGPFVYRKNSGFPLWFHRTLILTAKEENEFCIINDQYHIDNFPSGLNNVDLSELKIITQESVPEFQPKPFSTGEKYQLLRLMQELTTMGPEYCDKYLTQANWDIRQAIKTFMQTYVNNKVPSEAFRHGNIFK